MTESLSTEEQVGAHHCTPGAIQALLADLDAIGECREFPPLQDRDHRARAGVVACVIRHLQTVGVRLAGEKFILKSGLREAREYILDNCDERKMAPVIERIDDALQSRPADDVPACTFCADTGIMKAFDKSGAEIGSGECPHCSAPTRPPSP